MLSEGEALEVRKRVLKKGGLLSLTYEPVNIENDSRREREEIGGKKMRFPQL